MSSIILSISRGQFVNLSRVTKVSVTGGKTVRMWAGSNIEVFSAPVSDYVVATAIVERLAVTLSNPNRHDPVLDGVLSWSDIVADAEEYAEDRVNELTAKMAVASDVE